MRLVLPLLIAVGLYGAPQGSPLTWSAPPECPTGSDVQARASRLAGGKLEMQETSVVAVVHAPLRVGAPWWLELRIDGGPPRRLEGESCEALADAAAVMLEMQGAKSPEGPALVPTPEPPAVEPARPPPLEAEPRSVAPAERTERSSGVPSTTVAIDDEAESSRPPLVPFVGAMAGVHGLGLPGVGGGISATLGVRVGRLRLAGYGQYWFRRERAVVDSVLAAYRLGLGGVEACGAFAVGRARSRFELLGCGQAEVGQLRADGLGAAPSRTQRHLWVALGGGLGTMWRGLAGVGLGVRATALAPLIRRRFVVGDVVAGEIGGVELRLLAGLEVQLGGLNRSKKTAGK